MNLLNKSKISIYPGDIRVSELITGDLIEACDFYDNLYLQRMVVYSEEDTSLSEYYSINSGNILLPSGTILLELVVDGGDMLIKETEIDNLKKGMYLCDASLVSQFNERKNELIEIGVTSEALEIHRTINGLGDEFTLPLPIEVIEIELISETEECKNIEVGYQDQSTIKNSFIFVDDVAVKVN